MLVLSAEITHKQARACAVALKQGLPAIQEPQVVLDASAMVKFDSSALAVMLQCRREALGLGKSFIVQGLTPRLRDLATLYGIVGLLEAA